MLEENFIKYTRKMKLIRKAVGPIGDKKVKGMLNKTKPWGGGKTSKILLCHMKVQMNSPFSM